MNKWIKIPLIVLASILALILAVITVAVWVLTPGRLTPLVKEAAEKNLNAKVDVEKVELSFWSTFPRLELDIDRLKISPLTSNDTVQAWNELLELNRFHGALSLPKLFIGHIAVDRVTLDNPRINLVKLSDESANYDIVPSDNKEEPSSEPTSLPEISIGRFEILGNMMARYYSVPDSTDINITLSSATLDGDKNPTYALDVTGATYAHIGDINLNRLRIGMGGEISWDPSTPFHVALDQLQAALGDVTVKVSTDADFESTPTFKSLSIELLPVSIDSIMAIVPAGISSPELDISGDAKISAKITLAEPYELVDSVLPSVKAVVDIEKGSARYDQIALSELSMQAETSFIGKNPDASRVDIKSLKAVGEGAGFTLSATITSPVSDPYIDGKFKGGLSARWLSPRLLNALPFVLEGKLMAECTFALRSSWLSAEEFHRIKFDGDASVDGLQLDMRDASASLYLNHADLTLGSSSRITVADHRIDSLLTASMEIDTLSFFTPGLRVQGRRWKMGIGALNTSSSADTTVINPIGGKITTSLLTLDNPVDSARMLLRDASVSGSLTRFKGDNKKPRLSAKVTSRRAIYAQDVLRAFISDIDAAFTVHPSSPRIGRRTQRLMDSIAAVHPQLPADSLYARAIAMNRRSSNVPTDSLSLAGTINLDGSTVDLLKKWGARGHVKASRIGVFTPMFPIRNVVTDLNMTFTQDSLTITDTHYRIGRNTLSIDGNISNIARSLISRRGTPIKIDFNIKGDTLDVNRIATAAFAGAAYGKSCTRSASVTAESEAEMQRILDDAARNDSATAIIIPPFIDARLHLDIEHVLYSNLTLNKFAGTARLSDGALNLHNIKARTDVGSINLNALYSAPDEENLKFAFGMLLKDFYIDRFLQLMPAIDSVMPLLNGVSGIINADVAATSRLTPQMDIDIPSLSAAVKISGDSLVLLDSDTFKKVSKWLLFKDKKKNMIDHMEVEMIVDSQHVELFPFIFDMDRYRLGVMGSNDLALNFKYHVAVLKSPIPFKFGINISGNPDKMKIRLGGAKLTEKKLASSTFISDTTRINLVRQIESAFIRGVRSAKVTGLKFTRKTPTELKSLDNIDGDTISRSDSLLFIREGLIEAPLPPDSIMQK